MGLRKCQVEGDDCGVAALRVAEEGAVLEDFRRLGKGNRFGPKKALADPDEAEAGGNEMAVENGFGIMPVRNEEPGRLSQGTVVGKVVEAGLGAFETAVDDDGENRE